MISNIITIGDKITLTKVYNSDENNNEMKQYVSSIMDIHEDEYLHIGMPTESGHMVALQVGDNYQFSIYTKRGLYQCSGMIVERYRDGAVNIAIVRILSSVVRQQRRQFYRLEKIMDIMHCLYIEPTTDEPVQYQWERAILTDISGGGARFNSKTHYDSGGLVLLKIILPLQSGEQEFVLMARIISSQMLLHRSDLHETRVEFSEIELSQREAIIRFVFEEERKQRRREKGLV